MAAATKKKAPTDKGRNADRPNGKRWSGGKSPAARAAEARKKTDAKRARKAANAAL